MSYNQQYIPESQVNAMPDNAIALGVFIARGGGGGIIIEYIFRKVFMRELYFDTAKMFVLTSQGLECGFTGRTMRPV